MNVRTDLSRARLWPRGLSDVDGRPGMRSRREMGIDNNMATRNRPMATPENMNNGTDAPVGDNLARLSINDKDEGGFGVRVTGSGSMGDEVKQSDSLEVLQPASRLPIDPENIANGWSRPGRKRGQGDGAVEASSALHALQQAQASGGKATSKGKGPSLPARTSGFVDKAASTPGQMDEEQYVEEDDEESSEISASDEDGSWITWFCSLRGNEFFCEVDEDYIQVSTSTFMLFFSLFVYSSHSPLSKDDFNLTGLSSLVPYYDYALDMVLDVEMPMEDSLTEEQQEIVESAAVSICGVISFLCKLGD